MRLACLPLALLALVAPAFADSTPLPIGGTVLDAGGQAVAGATAELSAPPAPGEARQLAAAGRALPSPLASAKTGADGRFALTAPAAGVYLVRVEAPGRLPWIYRAGVVEGMELPPLELVASSPLAVRVEDAAGKPVAGARVRLAQGSAVALSFRRYFSGPWRVAPRLATTGADGRAYLSRGAGEELRVRVQVPGQGTADLPVAAMTGAVEVRLAGGCPRALEVRDAAGQPAADVGVTADGWAVGATDAEGRSTVPASCRGETEVKLATADGRQARAVLRPTSAGTVRLRLPPPAPARAGRVLTEGTRQPVPGALVWLDDDPAAATRTDARGGYLLPRSADSPEDGRRGLSVAAAGYFDGRWEIAATGAAPTVALKRAATLAGTVVEEGTRRPVDGAALTASPIEASLLSLARAAACRARSSREGTFRLKVEPGAPLELQVAAAGFASAKVRLPAIAAEASRGGLAVVLSRGRRAVGRVTDGAGTAIAGAAVELQEAPAAGGREAGGVFFPVRPDVEKPLRRAATDADGRFSLEHLDGGRYDLTARAPGFAVTRVRGLTLPAGAGESDLGTVRLEPGVTLAGRVVDRGERPIAGAVLKLWPDEGEGRGPRLLVYQELDPVQRETQSGADGAFAFPDLRGGSAVLLSARASGFVAAEPTRVSLPAAGPVRLVLAPAARLSGRVVDDRGDPVIALVSVTALAERQNSPDDAPVIAVTDREGCFLLDGLAASRVELDAQAEGYVPPPSRELALTAGREMRDVEMVVSRGAQVEGAVLAPDGSPVTGARVEGETAGDPSRHFIGPQAITDGDGRFRLTGLAPGVQSLSARHEGYVEAEQDLELTAGEIGRVELRLGEGLAVSGWVVDAAGAGVAGARVSLQVGDDFRRRQEWTGADGAFRFAGVASGALRLRADKDGVGAAQRDDLKLTEAPLTGVELRLARGGAIAGRILGLSAAERSEVKIEGFGGPGPRGGSADVDFAGRYRMENVGAGAWRVSARLPGTGRSASGQVEVPEGAEVTLDLEFGDGLTLAGRVLYGGQPLAGATVGANPADGAAAARSVAATDWNGAFAFQGLKAGTYHLFVFKERQGIDHPLPETVELTASRDDVLIDIPAPPPQLLE